MKKEEFTKFKSVLADALNAKPSVLSIEALPTRNRYSKRKRFYRVDCNNEIFYHVTVANDLESTYQNSLKFHTAAPSLACKPISYIEEEGLEVYIQEYSDGSTLQELITKNKLSDNELNEIIADLASSLTDLEETSSKTAAREEFTEFSKALLESAVLPKIDKLLLKDHLLPELEHFLIGDIFYKRWTNGDLIGQNLMISNAGKLTIIDCEFANCTHFFHEDWIRFKMFSDPRIGESSAYLSEYRSIPRVYEAYFWLHQIILAEKVFSKSKAREYIPRYLQEFFSVFRSIAGSFNSASFMLAGIAERNELLGEIVAEKNRYIDQVNERSNSVDKELVSASLGIDDLIGRIENQLTDKLSEVESQNDSYNSILNEILKVSRFVSESVSKIEEKNAILLDLQSALSDKERYIQSQGIEIHELKLALSKCNDEIVKNLAKNQESADQIRSVNLENESLQEIIQRKDTLMVSKEQELQDKNLCIQEQEARLLSYRSGFSDICMIKDELQSKVNFYQNKIKIFKDEVNALKKSAHHWIYEFRKSEGSNKQMLDDMHQLKRDLEAAEIVKSAISSKVHEMEKRILQLDDEKASRDAEIENLRIQVEEASRLNEGLLREIQVLKNESQIHLDKVHRMRTSFSWKVTSPLRFLRRNFLDSKKLQANSSPAPVPPVYEIEKSASEDQDIPITDPYHVWIQKIEPTLLGDYSLIKSTPKVSILVPVYKPALEDLRSAIESVIRQGYTNWELCLVDDCSDDTEVIKIFQDYASRDKRIKFRALDQNCHISKCTNIALEMATGEYVAFLDHDDLLREFSLSEMVLALNENPSGKFFYSDEDKIDGNGRRHSPHFKTDWNPLLILSQNYICHFLMVETSLVREVGGLREGYEGSQDWDLILRITDKLERHEIVHIPKVLYHWRETPNSSAGIKDAKPYSVIAAEKALHDHYQRNGIEAEIELHQYGGFIPTLKLSSDPSLSIIIPTRNGGAVLARCLESLYATAGDLCFEVLVVDNGSDEIETLQLFERYKNKKPNFQVVRDESPFNYSAINNKAVNMVSSELVLLLNDDTEFLTNDWLLHIKVHAMKPEVGAVGAKLLYPNDTIQHGAVIIGLGGVAGHAFKGLPRYCTYQFNRLNLPHCVSAVTAAFLCIKRNVFLEVGGLNEEDLKIAFNDVDFCLKVRDAGYYNLYLPMVEVRHYESYSRGYEDTPEKQRRFQAEVEYMKKTWKCVERRDPYYNPNFSLDTEQFHIRTR